MSIKHDPSGLLPAGVHAVTWPQAHALLVEAAPPEIMARRAATFNAVMGLAHAVAPVFGPGDLFLGGDFMRFGAPTDICMVAYQPADEDVANAAGDAGIAASFLNISDVAYSSPGAGGYLKERAAVGGCVDAFITNRTTRRAFVTGLGAVMDPHGFAQPGVAQGVLKVVIEE